MFGASLYCVALSFFQGNAMWLETSFRKLSLNGMWFFSEFRGKDECELNRAFCQT